MTSWSLMNIFRCYGAGESLRRLQSEAHGGYFLGSLVGMRNYASVYAPPVDVFWIGCILVAGYRTQHAASSENCQIFFPIWILPMENY